MDDINSQQTIAIVNRVVNYDVQKLSCDNKFKDDFILKMNTPDMRTRFETFKDNFIRQLECDPVILDQFPKTVKDEECYMLRPYYATILWIEKMTKALKDELALFNRLHALKGSLNNRAVQAGVVNDPVNVYSQETMQKMKDMLLPLDANKLSCIIAKLSVKRLSGENEYRDAFTTKAWAYENRFKQFKANFINERKCEDIFWNQYTATEPTPEGRVCNKLRPYYDAVVWIEQMKSVLEEEQALFDELQLLRLSVLGRTLT